MNIITKFFGILLFGGLLTTSCGNNETDQANADTTANLTTLSPSSDGIFTITATFVNGGSFENDADFIFKKEDGSTIDFYRNYNDPKEPELKFGFIGADGASPSPELVGQTFVIKYKINQKGRMSLRSGELEPCNQIISVEKK